MTAIAAAGVLLLKPAPDEIIDVVSAPIAAATSINAKGRRMLRVRFIVTPILAAQGNLTPMTRS
jgi:hypothetical protein